MTTREKIILEAEDRASREFDKATGGYERMSRTMKRLAIGGGIAIAGAAIGRVSGQVLGLAVDAQEASDAFATSFGEALPQASAFVDDFSSKAGFARHELEQLMAITGSVVQGIGATEAESAELSERMAVLAGDVASFSNAQGGAEAVLQALQSAINGEREALKTYGLAITEAEVQQRALNETGKEGADDLTRLEKAQATVTLAYEKGGKAVGDLDRTQDSAANTLRRLQGRLKDAGVEAGNTLLPAVEDLLPVLEDLIPVAADAGSGIAAMFASVGPAAGTALGHIETLAFGIGSAFNLGSAGVGRSRKFLEELFSFGLADTSGLDAGIQAADRAQAVAQAVRDLRNETVPGADAADHYANSLVFVARRGDLTVDAMERLGAASGATAEEQRVALQALLEFADENNWRTENITLLEDELTALNMELYSTSSAPDHLTESLGTLQGQAGETADELDDQESALERNAERMAEMREEAEDASEALREDLLGAATDFITGFEELPDAVDTTMDEFETNLTDRIAAQEEFWEGLTELAAEGLVGLAEEIRAQGPEAQGLLDDMTGDMEEAARLDDMITGAEEDMGALTGAYADALEGRLGSRVKDATREYGESLPLMIVDGIEDGPDVGMALLNKIGVDLNRAGINAPTPTSGGGRGENRGPGAGHAFQMGTWEVPGSGPIGAIVHGGETIFGPPGSSGRAAMVRDLAAELARVTGGGGGEGGEMTVRVVLVDQNGRTLGESIGAAGAEAAIEAHLS